MDAALGPNDRKSWRYYQRTPSTINLKGEEPNVSDGADQGAYRCFIDREFMTRTERYSRGIRMTRRFYELRELHKWSPEQTYIALGTISADEALPIQLHMAGATNCFLFTPHNSCYFGSI